MEKVFVVDVGFGFTKWLYQNKKGKIRSCYKKIGDSWLVGEKALLETGSRYLRTVEELVDTYPVFVKASEEKAGIKESERSGIVITAGLPCSIFEDEEASFFVEKLEKKLRGLNYKDVFVFPQGLGGIKWFLKNNPEARGNVLGLDVGFNTVIAVLYSVDEREILVSRTYYKKGVHDLTTSLLLPRIRKFLGERALTPIELNYLMEHKQLQIGFDAVDLTPEIEESVEEYVQDLISFIINDLKSSFGIVPFSYVVFMGGGANWLKDKVEGKKVKIVVLDEPEFANAFGFREKALEILDVKSNKKTEKELDELTEEEMFNKALSGEVVDELLGRKG